jgi:hypothetical protein
VHILNNHIKSTLLYALPDLVRFLAALLSPGIPIRQDNHPLPDVIPVVQSRLFNEVIWSLQVALEYHQVPAEMMMQIDLPPDAANGVPQFLQALRSLSQLHLGPSLPQTPALDEDSEGGSESGEVDAKGRDVVTGMFTPES